MSNSLYNLQRKTWDTLFSNLVVLSIDNTILCGGTALARLYLNHRVSYDLDFFVPKRFNPEKLLLDLAKIGVNIQSPSIEMGELYTNQLSGFIHEHGETLKIDFVEDIYQGMFDIQKVDQGFDDEKWLYPVITESIDGLYHRKIRTLSGNFLKTGGISSGRQTARDLFDLFVLNKSVEPINSFVTRINKFGANVPVAGLITAFNSVLWMELLDEFDELEKLHQWQNVSLRDVRMTIEHESLILRAAENDSNS